MTVASFFSFLPPQLMAVTVMWRRQVTGANWQVCVVAVVWGEAAGVRLWVAV